MDHEAVADAAASESIATNCSTGPASPQTAVENLEVENGWASNSIKTRHDLFTGQAGFLQTIE